MPLILTYGLRDVESEVPGDGGGGVVVFDVRAPFDFSWQRGTGNQILMRQQPRVGSLCDPFFCPGKRDWFYIEPGDTYSLYRAVPLTSKERAVALKSNTIV